MLCDYASVKVDKDLRFSADEPILRLEREQSVTIGAPLQQIFALCRLKQEVQLSNEQFGLELVLLVNHVIQIFYSYPASYNFNEPLIDAIHIDR